MFHPTQMSCGDTGLLVIDMQEKLLPKIPKSGDLIRNVAFLIDAATQLSMPVQATEQYPKGLGPTVPELVKRLHDRPDKVSFSCCAIPSVVEKFRIDARPRILVAGIEAHVCVQQTALDLLALDFRVYIAADAVGSRFDIDQHYALDRLQKAGCIITTCETAVFEWVGGSDHPQFKKISTLVQDRMKSMPSTATPW